MGTKLAAPLAIAFLLGLGGCADDSAMKKAEDRMEDALDRRPGEEVRDAAEQAKAAAEDFGEAVGEAASDAAKEVKDVGETVAEEAKEAAAEVREATSEATR